MQTTTSTESKEKCVTTEKKTEPAKGNSVGTVAAAVVKKTPKKPPQKAKKAAPKKAAPKKAAPKKTSIASDVPQMLDIRNIVIRAGANPRRDIDKKGLAELTASIAMLGVLQPIGVAPRDEDGKFELLWGERRLRACQGLGQQEILAVIKPGRTREMHYVMRMVENLQRRNLNPVDEAVAFQNYLAASGKIAKDLADMIGMQPAYVSQRLKILKMPPEVQLALSRGELNFTQARELGRMAPQEQIKNLKTIQKGDALDSKALGRKVEEARVKEGKPKTNRGRPPRTKDEVPDIARQNLETAMERLNNFAIEAKAKTRVRDALATCYDRFVNARSDVKKEQMKGAVRALEWALGIRDEL